MYLHGRGVRLRAVRCSLNQSLYARQGFGCAHRFAWAHQRCSTIACITYARRPPKCDAVFDVRRAWHAIRILDRDCDLRSGITRLSWGQHDHCDSCPTAPNREPSISSIDRKWIRLYFRSAEHLDRYQRLAVSVCASRSTPHSRPVSWDDCSHFCGERNRDHRNFRIRWKVHSGTAPARVLCLANLDGRHIAGRQSCNTHRSTTVPNGGVMPSWHHRFDNATVGAVSI